MLICVSPHRSICDNRLLHAIPHTRLPILQTKTNISHNSVTFFFIILKCKFIDFYNNSPTFHKGNINGIISGCIIKGGYEDRNFPQNLCFFSVFKVSCFAMWKTLNVNGRQNITSKNTVILRSQGINTAMFSGHIFDADQWVQSAWAG